MKTEIIKGKIEAAIPASTRNQGDEVNVHLFEADEPDKVFIDFCGHQVRVKREELTEALEKTK